MATRFCWRWSLLAALWLGLLPGVSPAGQGDPAPLPTPYLGGTYRALVIGNNDYRDPEGVWPRLKTAVNDAEAVAALLRERYGFAEVNLLRNATRSQIVGAFNELAERAGANDSVLIYYAGHGYLRESTREGFWIPVDAVGKDDSTFIPNVVVKSKLEVIAERARHVLLVSDSCFSGALLREGARGIRLEDKTPGYFQSVARKKSVQVLAAGGLEFVDDNYGSSGHSPFTYFLLNELREHREGLLDATDLSQRVTRNVADNVAQTPEKGVLYGAGHEGGEFLLTHGGLVPALPPGTAPSPYEPQAAVPAVAALAPALGATAVAGPALLYYGATGFSVGLGLYAVQQIAEANDLYAQSSSSASAAKSDNDRAAFFRSVGQERQADDALQNGMAAAVGAAALFALAYWWLDDTPALRNGAASWRLAPAVSRTEASVPVCVSVSIDW